MTPVPLVRSRDSRMLAGVCAGLAAHLGLTVGAVRIAMLVLTVFGGAGAVFYAWLWVTVPVDGETEGIVPLRRALTRPAVGTAPRSVTSVSPLREVGEQAARSAVNRRGPLPFAELLLGSSLLVAGVVLVLTRTGADVNIDAILPAMLVLVGVGLAWWQIADRDQPERSQVPRLLGALALVAVGVLTFFVTAREPNVWTVVTAAIAVLAGVALAIAPWLLRLNRELMAERAGRARESERAEIAAHLHDSVLQTLALIQQRSEPGSEVARLARRQERELREWLFRSADGPVEAQIGAVDAELRAHAAALESEYAVRFEIVAVGAGEGVVAPAAIVAAAREAMLNASRHAGGDVTVYLEITPEAVMIDITDRGPGVDLDGLLEGRMGIRESILGRMERAGGTARIVPGPGGNGTAVRLSVPRNEAQDDAEADRQIGYETEKPA